MGERVGLLVAFPYKVEQYFDGDYSVIRVWAKNRKERDVIIIFPRFRPYFYVVRDEKGVTPADIRKCATEARVGKLIHQISLEKKIDLETNKEIDVYKVELKNTRAVKPLSRHLLSKGYDVREFNIPFEQRFLTDTKLQVFRWVLFKYDDKIYGEDYTTYIIEKPIFRELKEEEVESLGLKEIPDLYYLIFDIETYNKESSLPGKAPIIAIGYKLLKGDEPIDEKILVAPAVTSNFERKLLQVFLNTVKKADIIIGHNITGFDIPAIVERAKTLGVEFNAGKLGDEIKLRLNTTRMIWSVSGRIIFDTLNVTKRDMNAKSYGLKNLLEEMGIRTKEERIIIRGHEIWKWYDNMKDEIIKNLEIFASRSEKEKYVKLLEEKTPREILIQYLADDVEDTYKLFKELYPLQLQYIQLINRDLQMVADATVSKLVDAIILNELFSENKVLPKPENIDVGDDENENDEENDETDEVSYSGALVHTPLVGIHRGVSVNDFKSLYPNVIITFNISIETFLGKMSIEEVEKRFNVKIRDDSDVFKLIKLAKEKYKLNLIPYYNNEKVKELLDEKRRKEAETGKIVSVNFVPTIEYFLVFTDEFEGFIPRIVRNILVARYEAKEMMKKAVDEKMKKVYEVRQLALKRFANSMYGYLGYTKSLIFRVHIAEAVTSGGRTVLVMTSTISEKLGVHVIYGDTDSVFLKPSKEMVSDFISFLVGEKTENPLDGFLEELEKVRSIFG